jgi:hypothetical protein
MPTFTVQKRKSLNPFWLFGIVNNVRGQPHEEEWAVTSPGVKTWYKETCRFLKETVTTFPATVQVELPEFVEAERPRIPQHEAILARFKSDLAEGVIDPDTSFADYYVHEVDNTQEWA